MVSLSSAGRDCQRICHFQMTSVTMKDYDAINFKMKSQVFWKMWVCETMSLTLEKCLNHVQSHGRQEEIVNNREGKKNWPNLADTVGDSFNISHPLLFLPVSTLEAGKAEITFLPVFPAASENWTAQGQMWLHLFLTTWSWASHFALFPSVCSSVKCICLFGIVLRIKWINMDRVPSTQILNEYWGL